MFLDAFLHDLSKLSYGALDLYHEFQINPKLLYTPVLIEKYVQCENRLEMVSNKRNVLNESDIKFFPTLVSSYLRKLKLHVKPEHYDILRGYLKKRIYDPDFVFVAVKDAKQVLINYYAWRFKPVDQHYYCLISDTIDYMYREKEAVSLILTQNQFTKMHNKFVEAVTRAERMSRMREADFYNKKRYITKRNRFNELSLAGFEMLRTKQDFILESEQQSNCVADLYYEKAMMGNCAILRGKIENRRYTLEVGIENEKFKVLQLCQRFNKPYEADDLKKVERMLGI